MRIAVDAMGGDHAPDEIVRGALDVASEPGFAHQIILVGDEKRVQSALSGFSTSLTDQISIRHTSEEIAMHEHGAQAVRKKRESSLVVCGQMVKDGEADATLSAGNTGAAMAVATLVIGRIPGIERPAIATTLPTVKGQSLLLDVGANVDCSPHNLLQFALLGSIYAEKALGIPNPTIGLLSIGSEESKGNDLTKKAYKLLQESPLRFYGNVEGKDAFEHTTDVVVCDGFAGNVLLKSGEGVAEMMLGVLQREIASFDPTLIESFKPVLGKLLRKIDYAETGGAPLLGVNGVSMIAHGRSRAKAIASAIRKAIAAASAGFVKATAEALPALTAAEQRVIEKEPDVL
ncbi:MAG TPA: phosphate acyltransferase PlsX [Capsulimonadaceae bacterium]|nr:phosphate acyltransferase PlsX [Capsulimonadaceae bacterium]